MYLHLGAPRLFVTILYINSGYDRLSYLYCACLGIDSLCNWMPRGKNHAMKVLQQLPVCAIVDITDYSKDNLDRILRLMLRLLLRIQEVSGSNLVSWAGYHH